MDHFHSVMAGSGVRLVDCDTLGNALRRGEGRDRRRAYEVRLTAVRRSPLQYLRRHGRLDVERCVALYIMAHAIAVFFGREPGNSEFADVDSIARAGSLDVVFQGLVGDFYHFLEVVVRLLLARARIGRESRRLFALSQWIGASVRCPKSG